MELREQLRKSLSSLPKAVNEVKIVAPELEDVEAKPNKGPEEVW